MNHDLSRKLSAISFQLKRYAHASRTAISFQLKRYAHASRTAISFQLSAFS
ncbi:hypothetical protein [Moorena sp. SIO4E2]|uniref:hypothetical protein n=1 Tax=Moorena sp. SIO4E2 TaxID=2607826 RepID=UPI00257CD5D9|nr:hypothetical protein [Moorena sp. SIO4E2]